MGLDPIRSLKALGACALLATAAGCSVVAPTRLATDRLDFNRAVSDSWKEQALLNLVRLRYSDMPVVLEVASVISSRSLEAEVNASVGAVLDSDLETVDLGGRTTVGNRPTVTYTPLSGERFTHSMMTPVQPAAIFGLIQSGWSADFLLRATVHSINDIGQGFGAAADTRPDEREFEQVLAALKRVQAKGLIGLQVTKGEGGATLLVFRHRASIETPENAADAALLRRLLGLSPDAMQFSLVYGVQPRNDREIAVLTRSMFEIMRDMSRGVQPIVGDLAAGRVRALPASGGAPLMVVHSGAEAPADAFLAVRYRDHWFWIAGDDLPSRLNFSFLMLLLSLTESGGSGQAPLITLPTG